MNQFLVILTLLMLLPNISMAYLDGGFISMVVQFIVATIAVGLVYIKIYFGKINKFLNKIILFFKKK